MFVDDAIKRPKCDGQLQLRTFTISYAKSAFFRTEVAPYGTTGQSEDILPAKLTGTTGRTIGSADLKLNTPAYHTGSHRFQVAGQNTLARIKISNDTHVASTFVSAEWEGFYHNRAA